MPSSERITAFLCPALLYPAFLYPYLLYTLCLL
jgi:hypothetical protein